MTNSQPQGRYGVRRNPWRILAVFLRIQPASIIPATRGWRILTAYSVIALFICGKKCPGSPRFLDIRGKIVKDCTDCTFPHRPENYDAVIQWIKRENEKRVFSEEIRKKAIKVVPDKKEVESDE